MIEALLERENGAEKAPHEYDLSYIVRLEFPNAQMVYFIRQTPCKYVVVTNPGSSEEYTSCKYHTIDNFVRRMKRERISETVNK